MSIRGFTVSANNPPDVVSFSVGMNKSYALAMRLTDSAFLLWVVNRDKTTGNQFRSPEEMKERLERAQVQLPDGRLDNLVKRLKERGGYELGGLTLSDEQIAELGLHEPTNATVSV